MDKMRDSSIHVHVHICGVSTSEGISCHIASCYEDIVVQVSMQDIIT